MPFEFTIDPDLPLPLGTQLRGLIEYGIACGEIDPGSRLPSVRDLAERAGIAPMTVSQVYKDLQESGLIEGRRGQGTFVRTDARAPMFAANQIPGLRAKVDDLINAVLDDGLAPADLARLFSARLNRVARKARPMHAAIVGEFKSTTREFVAELGNRLAAGDKVTGATYSELKEDRALRQNIAGADVVLAFANRKVEVAALLKTKAPIVAISYIPSDKTRLALAGLDPMKRVGVVSTFANFLPIMKAGVERLAPQVGVIRVTVLGSGTLMNVINDADVVIYATGAEKVIALLPDGTSSFEYRHVLHPHEVQNSILPLIEKLRSSADTLIEPTHEIKEAV